MKLLIDNREKEFVHLIPKLFQTYNFNYHYDIVNLPLGDFVITDPSNNDILIIERKKLSDLASSIRDGRYNEQSFRLNGSNIHNHNIIYLIEGNLNTYNPKYSKIDKYTLISSMISLNYYKGFSVFRTNYIDETAEFIVRLIDKISREHTKGKTPYYTNINPNSLLSYMIPENNTDNKINIEIKDNLNTSTPTQQQYSTVVKKVKKDNITPENIGEIILSQIPGISNVISLAIINQYGSLYQLLMALEQNKNCLDNFTYQTSSGQNRKLPQKVINSIINYLLYQKNNQINFIS